MATINRQDALRLFTFEVPTLASATHLFGNQFQDLPTGRTEVAPLALPGLEVFAGPLVWAIFEAPKVRAVWVDNVEAWTGALPFSTDDGATNFDTAPVLGEAESEFKQVAAILDLDGAAGPLESTRFETSDALLRATAEMMYSAVLRQMFAWTGKANGFTTLRDFAAAQGTQIDAGGHRLSLRLLLCLLQSLNKYEGRPEQYSIVLSPGAYADFVELMLGNGTDTTREDAVTGHRHWFFDGVRVVQSKYLPEPETPWGVLYKVHAAALPAEMQRTIQPSQRGGVVLMSNHRGAVLQRFEKDGAPDRIQNNVQVTAGLYLQPNTVASLVNLGT